MMSMREKGWVNCECGGG
uniref:Uncharacterized protein n=1 Tax=Rhizophora mucronata TaxID=61149 RepID=A0A2P2PKK8_RHIMU